MATLTDLKVTLLSTWVVRPSPPGVLEFARSTDGSTGILQVSLLDTDDDHDLFHEGNLAALARKLAEGLSKRGQNWGTPVTSTEGNCALGRFGLAVFTNGQFPAMLLWVTASETSALMWTWLGPDPQSREVEEASRMVMSARW